MHLVLASEAQVRKNQRRTAGMIKLTKAVGAIVGGVLDTWGRYGAVPVWRSNQAEKFTGAPVGRRQFSQVISILKKAGLIHHKAGGHPPREPSFLQSEPDAKGTSSRYWPTATLLAMAVAHGVTPETMKEAFGFVASTRVPRVASPISLRPLLAEPRNRRLRKVPSALRQTASLSDPEAAEIMADVEAQNALAAQVKVEGCTPPRWCRVFHGHWSLHGRWYAAGSDGGYQTKNESERAKILIDGEAVVELDVSASHLRIFLGLRNSAECTSQSHVQAGDLYAGMCIPRDVAKAWVMEALGKGRPPFRWSAKAKPEVQARSVKAVATAVLAHHPGLVDPSLVVPADLAKRLEVPIRRLVNPYLTAIEADAITRAMCALRQIGVLSLPVHDSLIVPVSAEQDARRAIAAGYMAACGVLPVITAKRIDAGIRKAL